MMWRVFWLVAVLFLGGTSGEDDCVSFLENVVLGNTLKFEIMFLNNPIFFSIFYLL